MKWFRWLVISVLVVLITLPGSVASVWASTHPAPDGQGITQVVVSGKPPKEIKTATVNVPELHIQGAIDTLSGVPAFDWSYGCSATSAAMLFGYYDRNGYSNMYTGATNGGICPLSNSIWGHTAYPSVTCGECPLSATHQGVDGRSTRGDVDDYWINYGNAGPDPFIVNGWTPHNSDCTADFMGTSQSKFGMSDGATTFFFYNSGDPLYDYTGSEPTYRDGCHGMKLFAQSRGYSVTTNFNQLIQGKGTISSNGFTFANYMAEIDAGRPVLIQVAGHTMLGWGYNSVGNIVYIHDTWDYSDHTMTWGGSYSGMQQYGVTVLRLAGSPSPPPPSSTLTVTLPNGGESWQAGTSQTIRWTYTGSPGASVKIELLKGGVLNSTITSNTATSTGSYSWLIPSSQTAGSDYRVKITSTSNTTITDTSDGNFTVIAPTPATITVVAPNGLEIWQAGTSQAIRWTYTGSPGAYVQIDLLKGGVLNRTITSSTTTSTGSYSWLIPTSQTVGSDYRVKITSTNNTSINDISNGNFTIIAPPPATLTVTSPNGGESWQAGTSQIIRWTYTGSPGDSVKIELLKGGVLNSTITSSTTTSTGSYGWLIPSSQTVGTDYQVRLTSAGNATIADTSDGNFTIIAPPSSTLTVISPNGGESWRAGTSQTIMWTYTGNPGAYVKIELLKGGVVNRVITSSAAIGSGGSGYYRWASYFQTAGSNYKVRITSTSNIAITDSSNANFSITT